MPLLDLFWLDIEEVYQQAISSQHWISQYSNIFFPLWNDSWVKDSLKYYTTSKYITSLASRKELYNSKDTEELCIKRNQSAGKTKISSGTETEPKTNICLSLALCHLAADPAL